MAYRRVVYGAMTTFEEDKLRNLESELLECLDDAGRTERHYWSITVHEGVRYVTLGQPDEILRISSKRILATPAQGLVKVFRRAISGGP